MAISKEIINGLIKTIQNLYLSDDIPWMIGYSGGKDSTAALQLAWIAIEGLPERQRVRREWNALSRITLSRMDSQHRTSIISTYFPNASDQTIILSTDTEIDQNYYEMMKNSVGDEFTLVYSEETKSTSIKKGYFQEL